MSRADNFVLKLKNVCKTYSKHIKADNYQKSAMSLMCDTLLNGYPQRKYKNNGFHALNDVNICLKKGESVGIIGLNGSGKSTLLQIISKTLEPSKGLVRINGRVGALLELGSGFNADFSGIENIYLNASLLGFSTFETKERIKDIINFADIGDHINQPVKTYSTGMILRLAFSVIAHTKPDILIIDEALAVGDAIFVQKCMRFLQDFQKNGSLILVSHDLGAIKALCQRTIWLKEGLVHKDGNSKVITDDYHAFTKVLGDAKETQKKIEIDSLSSHVESDTVKTSSEGFGTNLAKITEVRFVDSSSGKEITTIFDDKEKMVSLKIWAVVLSDISQPIIGFYCRNRIGLELFGDNTFKKFESYHLASSNGQTLYAQFDFLMPILPVGDYSISVAISEGVQSNHIGHQWMPAMI